MIQFLRLCGTFVRTNNVTLSHQVITFEYERGTLVI